MSSIYQASETLWDAKPQRLFRQTGLSLRGHASRAMFNRKRRRASLMRRPPRKSALQLGSFRADWAARVVDAPKCLSCRGFLGLSKVRRSQRKAIGRRSLLRGRWDYLFLVMRTGVVVHAGCFAVRMLAQRTGVDRRDVKGLAASVVSSVP